MKRQIWELALALLAGLGLGLLYSWVLSPVRYVDTLPNSLRADFKDQFRSAIAAAYAATGNLERARARLAVLGDSNSIQALSAQAQQMLAAGGSGQSVEQIARLASALGQPETAVIPTDTTAPTQTSPVEAAITITSLPVEALTTTDATSMPGETQSTPTINVIATATPRPTRTPTPAPGAPYELIGQDSLCQPDVQEGLLEVIVMDARRHQVPGVEIVVTWDRGEDHFFTGFKPELGDGYGDFVMQVGTVYSVLVANEGSPVSNLSAPTCNGDTGTYTGALKLTFQQP